MKRRLSTAFHPQTDGATERQNQILEIFLRSYINYQQNKVRLLAPAQYNFNNSGNKVTGKIPFSVINRFKLIFRMNPAAADSDVPKKTSATRQQIETQNINNRADKTFWIKIIILKRKR
jgi:hypothetical protein